MLITCKKGTNETLKNPENTLFLHFFPLFRYFFQRFLCLFHFLVVLLRQRKKSKSTRGFITNKPLMECKVLDWTE